MKKLLVAGLCVLCFSTSVYAQEEGRSKCAPFDKIIPQLKEHGVSPIFLGLDNNHANIGVFRDKSNSWQLVQFRQTSEGVIVACLITQGDYGVILQEEVPPPQIGL